MEEREQPSRQPPERPAASTRLNRRDWLKATVGGGAGLAVGGLVDFKRTGCPFCETHAQRLASVTIEGERGLRIDHCESCGGYLKTYDGEGNESVLLADWTSLHLDILARDRGLKRRAASLYDL